jgi:hypothetical protein
MSKLYGYTHHFRGIFGLAKEFFRGNFKNYLKIVFYSSESWSFR